MCALQHTILMFQKCRNFNPNSDTELKLYFYFPSQAFWREISEGVGLQCTVFAKCVNMYTRILYYSIHLGER